METLYLFLGGFFAVTFVYALLEVSLNEVKRKVPNIPEWLCKKLLVFIALCIVSPCLFLPCFLGFQKMLMSIGAVLFFFGIISLILCLLLVITLIVNYKRYF